jgi:hypothetical protein
MKKPESIFVRYKQLIAAILQCDPIDIKFYISERGNIGEAEWKIRDELDSQDYIKNNTAQLGYYEIFKDTIKVASFRLYQMPHCCAYVVSCNALVYEDFKNKGIGTLLNQLRQDIGIMLGYSSILCTDIESNTSQRNLLRRNEWIDVHSVVNKRTKNKVFISIKDL